MATAYIPTSESVALERIQEALKDVEAAENSPITHAVGCHYLNCKPAISDDCDCGAFDRYYNNLDSAGLTAIDAIRQILREVKS